MKNTILTFFIFIALIANGQNNYKNRIEINVLGLRAFPEVFTNGILPFYIFYPNGVSYTRIFKDFNLRTTYNYFNVTKYANDKNCNDCFYGTGKLKGYEIKAGIQKEHKIKYLLLFGGIDFSYINTKFKGSYGGGFTGGGFIANSIFKRYGLNPYFGLGFYPIKKINLSIETGFIAGKGYSKDFIFNNSSSFNYFLCIPIQSLAIQYKF